MPNTKSHNLTWSKNCSSEVKSMRIQQILFKTEKEDKQANTQSVSRKYLPYLLYKSRILNLGATNNELHHNSSLERHLTGSK